eukprot:2018604-Amphidinium_carterae.1
MKAGRAVTRPPPRQSLSGAHGTLQRAHLRSGKQALQCIVTKKTSPNYHHEHSYYQIPSRFCTA